MAESDMGELFVVLPHVIIEKIKEEMFLQDCSTSDAVRRLLLMAWNWKHEIVLDSAPPFFDAKLVCRIPSDLLKALETYAARDSREPWAALFTISSNRLWSNRGRKGMPENERKGHLYSR